MTSPSVLIAAGGTGGHIFPGIALADAVRRISPGARVAFVGTPRGLERRLVPEAGYELHLIDMMPLARGIGLKPLLAAPALTRASWQAFELLRAERPSAVVGMGGYPTLPAVVAARLVRVPSLVHEANAVAGLANKTAALFTRNVAVAFEHAASDFPRWLQPRVTGMPLRAGVAGMDSERMRGSVRRAFGLGDEAFVILALGGSLGALRVNEVAVALAERWRERTDLQILLISGRAHLATAEKEMERVGGRVLRVVPAVERIEEAYAAADVALCRAGAGTVAELPAAGLPAILVPYPHAPGDHQTMNARWLADAGAGVVVPDAQANATRIGPILEELADDPERVRAMRTAARKLARPGAAEELAAWVLELAGKEL